MAEPAKKEAAAKVQPIKPKKGKLLWVIIAVVLLGGCAGAWFAFKPKAAAADDAAAVVDKPASKAAAPQYYKYDPAFVVNFGGEGSARYLQVTVEAMTRNAALLDELKSDEPAVRNDLVLLLSSQDNATLMTVEGKEKLRAATLDTIQKVVSAQGADGKQVEAVYFTSFVIQ